VIALTLGDIADLTRGVVSDPADAGVLVTGPVVADSRRAVPGSLFVALPGERVDGHDFVPQALSAGAGAVLVTRAVEGPSVVVDDTVLALGRLAHGYLVRLADLGGPLVVGITGSSGKTSTKDIVGQLLAELGPTVAPEGSFNTEIGLPLTVLRADADTRYLVLEFSARGIDHIAYLAQIAHPRVGVVLNVGAAHIGEFGSPGVVAQAKGELVESLPADGVAVLNADDELVVAMRSRTNARVATFGLHVDADVRATDIRLDGLARPTFRLIAAPGEVDVTLALHGAHHVSNALAAAAVGLEAGFDLESLAAALGRARAISRWRMQVAERADGLVVINDAYNANPESVGAALRALVAMGRGRTGRRTHAVLGVMAELGAQSATAHRDVGAAAALLGVHRLVVVGAAAGAIADGAIEAGLDPARVTVVDDVVEAVVVLEADLGPSDVVLVKASRSADLQRVAEALLAALPVASAANGAVR
jgi:UDP-N-acetylmuramoyl-tripeptide--D-alanyl-D-alanine ligase